MALLAAFLCLVVMFIANWWSALVTFVCIVVVYKYIDHRSLDVNWGSSGQAYTYTMVSNAPYVLNRLRQLQTFNEVHMIHTGYSSIVDMFYIFVDNFDSLKILDIFDSLDIIDIIDIFDNLQIFITLLHILILNF